MVGRGTRTVARWAALRALAEGAAPDIGLLAAASGLTTRGIDVRARAEGWAEGRHTGRPSAPARIEARIARLMDNLVGEMGDVEALSVKGGLDKTRIDALTARMRLLEKLAEINEGRLGRQQEEHQKTDAEIADILRRIDTRIVELAREFAAELAGNQDGTAAPSTGGR